MHFQRRNSAKKRCNVGTFSGLHPSSYFAPLLREHNRGIVNLYQRLCCYAKTNVNIDTMLTDGKVQYYWAFPHFKGKNMPPIEAAFLLF